MVKMDDFMYALKQIFFGGLVTICVALAFVVGMFIVAMWTTACPWPISTKVVISILVPFVVSALFWAVAQCSEECS